MAAVVLDEEGGKHVPDSGEMLTSPVPWRFRGAGRVLEEQLKVYAKKPTPEKWPASSTGGSSTVSRIQVKEPVLG